MKRYKFTPKQWIIFDCGLGTAIGITEYRNDKPVVVFTSDSGESGVISYENVENPRKLCVESRNTNNIRNFIKTIPDSIICYTKGEA